MTRHAALCRPSVWAGLASLAVAGLWAGSVLLDDEPRFEGRSLSRWLEDPDVSHEEMRRGVRAIGTNAIPFFKEWLAYEETWLEERVRELNSRQHEFHFDYSPTVDAQLRAYRGFIELEELAAGELEWFRERWEAHDRDREFFAKMLALTGAEGIAVLINALPELPEVERLRLAPPLVFAATRQPAALEVVRRLLRDPSEDVRVAVTLQLWQQPGGLPPEFVALLQEALEGESERVRVVARVGLEKKKARTTPR